MRNRKPLIATLAVTGALIGGGAAIANAASSSTTTSTGSTTTKAPAQSKNAPAAPRGDYGPGAPGSRSHHCPNMSGAAPSTSGAAPSSIRT